MPTRQFELFSDDQADAMGTAFDDAWRRVSEASDPEMMPEQADAIREVLVEEIVRAARKGESDPQRLAETALQALQLRH